MIVNLKEILKYAESNNSAIASFSCYNYETVKGAIKKAEELKIPIIIALAESNISIIELTEFVLLVKSIDGNSKNKIVIHLDHCKSLDNIKKAIDAGFTSVMYDGSYLDFKSNIKNTKEVVNIAHSKNVSVEAELGSLELGNFSNEENAKSIYTDPIEASCFVKETNVDALAVSIGTVHGMYSGEPKIDIDILKKINNIVNIPLVLHGGSGTPEEVLIECIENGIRKVNINTEMSLYALNNIKNAIKVDEYIHLSELSIVFRKSIEEIVEKYINILSIKRPKD